MKLPPIADPERYAGLYVYDFGTHSSVGYTAAEIRILRECGEYRDGVAYEIYRVNERGGFELRGASEERLAAREAMCFLRREGPAARQDYDRLRNSADSCPLSCAAELRLTMSNSFDPPHVTALIYPASATTVVAAWLCKCEFKGGDRVVCGIDVHADLASGDGDVIDSCRPSTAINYEDRPVEEVLATVNLPLQR